MKKINLIFLLALSFAATTQASSLETKLSPQGADEYNFLITGDADSSGKKLRDIFQNKVNEVCGTRFEIISIKVDHISTEGVKKYILNGTFKCFVNSQM
jgi:predicted nuclease with TOPRIM domain